MKSSVAKSNMAVQWKPMFDVATMYSQSANQLKAVKEEEKCIEIRTSLKDKIGFCELVKIRVPLVFLIMPSSFHFSYSDL
jgi:hypothetical protein